MSQPTILTPFGQNPWLADRDARLRQELHEAWERNENVFMRNPADIAEEGRQEAIAWREGHREVVRWGVPSMDEVVDSMYAGRFAVVLGRPSEGKTLLAAQVARTECEDIIARAVRRGRDWSAERDYVLYVGLEEIAPVIARQVTRNVLAMSNLRRGAMSFEEFVEVNYLTEGIPLFVLGLRRRDIWGQAYDQAVLDGEGVWNEIMAMYNRTGRKPSLVVVDYLQALGVNAPDMRQEVARNVRALRDLARQLEVPVLLASQAKRVVDYSVKEGLPPIPDVGDSEFSAAAEQTADILLATSRPGRWPAKLQTKMREDGYVPFPTTHPEIAYAVTPTLVVIKLLKQRGHKGRDTFVLDHNVATGELTMATDRRGLIH